MRSMNVAVTGRCFLEATKIASACTHKMHDARPVESSRKRHLVQRAVTAPFMVRMLFKRKEAVPKRNGFSIRSAHAELDDAKGINPSFQILLRLLYFEEALRSHTFREVNLHEVGAAGVLAQINQRLLALHAAQLLHM